MRRPIVVLAVTFLTALGGSATVTSHGSTEPAGPAERGTPGHWSKVSYGTVGITYQASLFRTPDRRLHVIYPKDVAGGAQIGHTALDTDGSVVAHNDVLPSAWSEREPSPIVVGDTGGGLRVLFGGNQTLGAGYWSNGRVYTLTAPESGATWALPQAAVGVSHSAGGSYGTAATTLADGTPIAAFPLNSDLTWHVGTGEAVPDVTYAAAGCCLYDATMVRDGSDVWVAWYANGGTASSNGTFVKRIYPTVGPTLKAPNSSVGSTSVATGRVALAARTGGGVFAAYCVGSPTCNSIKLWKVGTTSSVSIPRSKYADNIQLSAGPSGRLWLAWSDNIPRVKATRTGVTGLRVGTIRSLGPPPDTSSIYTLALEGSSTRGDVVVNLGGAFWHTQVVAGMNLKVTPRTWRRGTGPHRVTFLVTDAGAALRGVDVRVGTRMCTTSSAGTCRLSFPGSFARGRHAVRASKANYATATATIKVT